MNPSTKRDWAKKWLATPKAHYIGGEWIETKGEVFSSVNPATGERLSEFPIADTARVNQAVSVAGSAFRSDAWAKLPPRARGEKLNRLAKVIREHEEELATLLTLENGKLYREALLDDMPDTSSIFEYYAGWVDKFHGETLPVEPGFLNYTLKQPLGVCALIVPWNFPLLLACWKIAPALAMGNTVIVKPSEYTPYSTIRMFEVIHEAKILPPGVLNLVLGAGATGGALSAHPGVNKISFTGSSSTGKKIVHGSADSNLKSVSLELGGKSPNIIFEDAKDLDAIIDRSFTAMFSQKGEKCSEPTRILIHDSLYDEVVEKLAQRCEAYRCGDPFDPQSDQGAQCNQAQYEKILYYIEEGKREGARLAAGGKADTAAGKGYFIRPTLFADVKNSMRIAQEEIFGPVLCAIRFQSEAQAIEIANDTIYGLAAGLWTADVSRAHRVAAQLDAGMVFINRYGCYDFASPFGGTKQSGWGKEMALHSLEAYTKTKSIWLKL